MQDQDYQGYAKKKLMQLARANATCMIQRRKGKTIAQNRNVGHTEKHFISSLEEDNSRIPVCNRQLFIYKYIYLLTQHSSHMTWAQLLFVPQIVYKDKFRWLIFLLSS